MKSREKRHWRVINNERGRWNVAVATWPAADRYSSTMLLYTLSLLGSLRDRDGARSSQTPWIVYDAYFSFLYSDNQAVNVLFVNEGCD